MRRTSAANTFRMTRIHLRHRKAAFACAVASSAARGPTSRAGARTASIIDQDSYGGRWHFEANLGVGAAEKWARPVITATQRCCASTHQPTCLQQADILVMVRTHSALNRTVTPRPKNCQGTSRRVDKLSIQALKVRMTLSGFRDHATTAKMDLREMLECVS
jgi:hypothetical protein